MGNNLRRQQHERIPGAKDAPVRSEYHDRSYNRADLILHVLVRLETPTIDIERAIDTHARLSQEEIDKTSEELYIRNQITEEANFYLGVAKSSRRNTNKIGLLLKVREVIKRLMLLVNKDLIVDNPQVLILNYIQVVILKRLNQDRESDRQRRENEQIKTIHEFHVNFQRDNNISRYLANAVG